MRGEGSFSRFDIFLKFDKSVYVRSKAGAIVTFVMFVFCLTLLGSELMEYNSFDHSDVVAVDLLKDERVTITFDISFLRMPCRDAVIDIVDEYGGQMVDLRHSVKKIKLSERGKMLDQVWTGLGSDGEVMVKCSACNVASRKQYPLFSPEMAKMMAGEDVCCSCAEVKEWYQLQGKSEQIALKSEQCKHEATYFKEGEDVGCRVIGYMIVDKVKGNFHVAAGASRQQRHGGHTHHVHTLNPMNLDQVLSNYNTSHFINSLRFGRGFPGIKNNQLMGHLYQTDKLTRMTYFIDLIPTFIDDHGYIKGTNQYSYTSLEEVVDYKSEHWHLPGVFFNFDFFPIRIKMVRLNPTFSHFMTRVCAVIGGMYVVIGIIYSSIAQAYSTVVKKDK